MYDDIHSSRKSIGRIMHTLVPRGAAEAIPGGGALFGAYSARVAR